MSLEASEPVLTIQAPGKVRRKFKSTRLIGEYEKPWLVDRDPRMKYDRIIFWAFGLIAAAGAAYLIYTGWASFIPQKVCLSLSHGLLAAPYLIFTITSFPTPTQTHCPLTIPTQHEA